ncbi:MAG: ATP-binding cassette domain-containing protein [Calditrichia bacterium]
MKLTIENASKFYQQQAVVQQLNLAAEPGTVTGVLGPNGAGKTTTLRMILNILHPDEGRIIYDGKAVTEELRNRMGYLPEERGIYQKYKVMDVMVYFGRLRGLGRRKSQVEAVRQMDRFSMIDYLEKPVAHLSKGMQQKLQFIISIMHNPSLLILDEPFWGLDPIHQEFIRKKIRFLKEEGRTIILSTHQLGDAEDLCDEMVLLNDGKTILQGALSEIKKRFRENIILVESEGDLSQLETIEGVQKVVVQNAKARLYINSKSSSRAILNRIMQAVEPTRLEFRPPSLKDIFLQVVPEKVEKST